jgi:DNA helicase-2/ATP-dependent DNA helicase PcrA
LKKIILKRADEAGLKKRIGYKLNYSGELNAAQYEAVMHNQGAALVIAGAGTGKTRTLIYRVARLVEDGVAPESILLLTFTRKASSQMLRLAATMLDGRCERVSGGTFHSFALQVLRQYGKTIGYENTFTVLDQGDTEDTINLLRSQLHLDKTRKRFPRKDTLNKMFNLAVNRCTAVEDIILKDYPHFIDDIDNVALLFNSYNDYKRRYNLMDYDDLLLNLLKLCREQAAVRLELNRKYTYLLVDEYQDTNRLQHEIVLQLAGQRENVMAVGDDAQSIYSFRGAEFQNIMEFPKSFNDCKIYKIEENYRSTQPILDLTNRIIEDAAYKYEKELFTRKTEGELPKVISAENERQQSLFVVQQVLELREQGIQLEDIAVLFRSGFLSFDLEIELNRANVPYRKFGGMKFIETAHIKDLLAFFKILHNPKDAVSWYRILLMLEGVGSRTASRTIDKISSDEVSFKDAAFSNFYSKGQEKIGHLFKFMHSVDDKGLSIGEKASLISDYYKPNMKNKYDDWQKRWKDIETFISIAERYKSMNEFLNDMAIEPPVESVAELDAESKEEEYLTLSTIHSAKGLEWKVLFLIWALDGRFPSTKSVDTIDTLEEERRLFYVACTRAKDYLFISYPVNIFDRESGVVLSRPSRFLDAIDEKFAERYIIENWETGEN